MKWEALKIKKIRMMVMNELRMNDGKTLKQQTMSCERTHFVDVTRFNFFALQIRILIRIFFFISFRDLKVKLIVLHVTCKYLRNLKAIKLLDGYIKKEFLCCKNFKLLENLLIVFVAL